MFEPNLTPHSQPKEDPGLDNTDLSAGAIAAKVGPWPGFLGVALVKTEAQIRGYSVADYLLTRPRIEPTDKLLALAKDLVVLTPGEVLELSMAAIGLDDLGRYYIAENQGGLAVYEGGRWIYPMPLPLVNIPDHMWIELEGARLQIPMPCIVKHLTTEDMEQRRRLGPKARQTLGEYAFSSSAAQIRARIEELPIGNLPLDRETAALRLGDCYFNARGAGTFALLTRKGRCLIEVFDDCRWRMLNEGASEPLPWGSIVRFGGIFGEMFRLTDSDAQT